MNHKIFNQHMLLPIKSNKTRNETNQVAVKEKAPKTKRSKETKKGQSSLMKRAIAKHRIPALITTNSKQHQA